MKLLLTFLLLAVAATQAQIACKCPRLYRPLCGSNGITYHNTCEFNCNVKSKPDLKVAYRGACKAKVLPPVVCDLVYAPVCGSNGVTYDNPCTLDFAAKYTPGLKLAYPHEC